MYHNIRMKTKYNVSIIGAVLALLLSACTEDTSGLGIYPEEDGISNSNGIYEVKTKSALLNSVLYTSTYSYLGRITDPETGAEISANFAAQFHTFEDYKFPEKERLIAVTDTEEPKVDSVEVHLYFNSYYGDKNNPMKLEVFPLSRTNIMEETTDYTTDSDLEQYVDFDNGPITTKVFTARDYILSDDEVSGSDYMNNIRITLPDKVGNDILRDFYADPSHFKDSYTFIRNVFPGLYFRISNGSGTMVKVVVGTMNLYFRYTEEGEEEPVDGICRFAATPEVIQSTKFDNKDLTELINDTCTYLKTPAGICTEITLPVNEIFRGHESDSISKAQLTLTRYNNKNEDCYTLDAPENVLMVRKQNATSFFKNHEVSNSQTSYTTPFNSAYNTYTFGNISRLITYCYYEKRNGMQQSGLGEAEWEAENPDWNKVMIIPVTITTSSDSYGNTIQSSVTHNMELSSTRLVGGDKPRSPINIQIVYSNFQ